VLALVLVTYLFVANCGIVPEAVAEAVVVDLILVRRVAVLVSVDVRVLVDAGGAAVEGDGVEARVHARLDLDLLAVDGLGRLVEAVLVIVLDEADVVVVQATELNVAVAGG